MPQLVTAMTENGEEIVAFPLREYWLDVGRIDDFERANDDYPAALRWEEARNTWVIYVNFGEPKLAV